MNHSVSLLLLVALAITSLFDGKNVPSVGVALSLCEASTSAPVVSSGLRNVGNTCYLNAQLQSAFHIPVIRDIALSIPVSSQTLPSDDETEEAEGGSPDEITEAALAFREVIEEMLRAGDNQLSLPYMPRSFCERLGIPPMVQQDSQEFWKLLLPAVGLRQLSDLYKGEYEDYISAIDGSGREKRRSEVFLDLSLDVGTSSTILDSLKDTFGEPELLDVAEGNGWRPEKGADKVNAHKGSSLLARGLPPILQFHLKRFEYDWNTDTTTKINKRFTFPQSLDLAPMCVDVKEDDSDVKSECEYELQAVIMHMGEFNIGHYYAYVRPDITSDQWYRFNDDKVDPVTFEEVTIDAFGGNQLMETSEKKRRGIHRRIGRLLFRNQQKTNFGWGGETSNAYVVQYVRKKNIESLYSPQ